MEMPRTVKGKKITSEEPIICIPIVETSSDEIIARAQELVSLGTQMIEWRIDYFEYANNTEEISRVFEALRAIVYDTILIATIRTRAQGGRMEAAPKRCAELLTEIAACHVADFIDVEFFTFEQPKTLIEELHRRGTKVICSHHDFTQTPPPDVMKMLLFQMSKGKPDMMKLAVMPQKTSDVLDLLRVTSEVHADFPDLPLITMSMGRMGMISRISGEIFGSCVTFGSVGESSAPGQVPAARLSDALAFVHEFYDE